MSSLNFITKTLFSKSKSFDINLIKSLKPFPRWLQKEMRSNHAGETG